LIQRLVVELNLKGLELPFAFSYKLKFYVTGRKVSMKTYFKYLPFFH
jgi:hypothetical protein